ncbi:MAG: VCBS repeat-containing protein [Polyangiaceae bacterium]|nr:VCBS repeat-containing protein [Polyangiaceae bacterium]
MPTQKLSPPRAVAVRRADLRQTLGLVASLVVASCAAADEPPTRDHEAKPLGEVSRELVSYSCAEHTDTGYTNGNAFTITVVTVDGEPVEVETANAFLTMAKAAESSGIDLRINSGFRTMAEQQYLYDCFINQNCNNGNKAAPPGYSNHQSGHALDLNTGGGALGWLNANAAAYGWEPTVPGEDWHWEWWGGGNPQRYCGCTAGSEVCDGKDNDCDGATDEDEVCEQERLIELPVAYAPPETTDVNGDGRADVCARASDGVHCALGEEAGGVGGDKLLVPLSDANGWQDASNHATLRMGDIDGDRRADLCARANDGVLCWTSAGAPLGAAVAGPGWSDAGSWNQTQHFSTIRLADIDGDGRDDLCARAASGVVCHRSTGAGFGPEIAGPAWSNGAGFSSAKYYGTLRMGDVNGDGKADVCVRAAKGVVCALSTGDGFGTTVDGPAWADANGWDNFMYWSSIRLADVNGDGKADVCARHSQALVCHFSTGTGFGPSVEVAALSNANGWDDPANYLTLRTGDVDGDGASDLCVRANTSVVCYAWSGGAFKQLQGPTWSDEGGWGVPQHYETIRVGDVNGDGKSDLCARAAAGWVCNAATGAGFGATVSSPLLTNAAGWAQQPYYGSILFGSSCKPVAEACNGRDDDCDGQVDEGGICDPPGGAGGGTSSSGGSTGSAGSASTGVGGRAGVGGVAGAPLGSGGRGGSAGPGGGGVDGGGVTDAPRTESSTDAGGCGVSPARTTGGAAGWLAIGLAAIARVRRRR